MKKPPSTAPAKSSGPPERRPVTQAKGAAHHEPSAKADHVSIEFLYVHYQNGSGESVSATVLADGIPEGPANKLIMLTTGSYEITLDAAGPTTPASIALDLGGTTQLRPRVLVFAAGSS